MFYFALFCVHRRENVNLVPVADPRMRTNFWRYSLLAWGAPLLLLGEAVALQLRQKGGNLLDTASLRSTNCWFLDRDAFVAGFVAPVGVLLVVVALLLARGAAMARLTAGLQVERRARERMRRRRRLQLCLFIKVTLLLSTVATLGALSKLTGINAFWVAFNVAHGLQGIAVALCVTCNCRVLKIYTRTLRRRGSNGKTRLRPPGGPSKSTSLQLLTWEPSPDSV